jgi:hypothetical protein
VGFAMIQHIYIVDTSGMPLYARCIGHDICQLGEFNSLSVSGLLSALNSLAKELGGESLQAIHMKKAKFLLKTEPNFFIAFQLESDDKIKKYQKSLINFSSFIQTIYPKSTPFNEKDKLKIVPEIDKFLDESDILTEPQGLLGKVKSVSSKLLKKNNAS